VGAGVAVIATMLAGVGSAQNDPVVGNWRGALKSAQGTESPLIITIAKSADGYAGFTNGLNDSREVPLTRVLVTGNRVTVEGAADSKLGPVVLTGVLTASGNTLSGAGTLAVGPQQFDVTFALQRLLRPDVLQHQVERGLDYFLGRWKFEYVGAEYPPLSSGGRAGTVTFSRAGTSNFAAGQVDGELLGKRYQESLSIGFDAATNSLIFVERRADGTELVSLASWQSPLAILFQTAPVQASRRTYQLRRVISVLSETAFDLTEEFSVDGSPYRRLGRAHYTRTP